MKAIAYSKESEQFLRRLDSETATRIWNRIDKLEANSVPHDAKFMKRDKAGEKVFRIRIGQFRVLYKLRDTSPEIFIAKIGKRSRVYD